MSILSRSFSSMEPDVREHVNVILNGSSTEPARGHWVLILRPIMNRPCCFNKTSGKWDEPDATCENCEGIGYIVDHVYAKAYKSYMSGTEKAAAPQIYHPHSLSYFVPHDTFESIAQAEISRLIEIRLDNDGNIIEPVIRDVSYNIETPIPYREGAGIQYWRLNVTKEEI